MNPVAAWLETDEGEDWSRARNNRMCYGAGTIAQLKPPPGPTRSSMSMRGPTDPDYDPAGAPPQ